MVNGYFANLLLGTADELPTFVDSRVFALANILWLNLGRTERNIGRPLALFYNFDEFGVSGVLDVLWFALNLLAFHKALKLIDLLFFTRRSQVRILLA